MKKIYHKFNLFAVMASLAVIITVGLVLVGAQTSLAQTPQPPAKRPFQLPFAAPPGPFTWLMAQPYGNTTGAYFQRNSTYGASGGIHFGVDLAAPCGTEILAIADGVVFAVDGPYGSPPHNLMIDHPQLGYASMYGHLLEAPNLTPGQPVKQGEAVALVGDSGSNCSRYPHLHLEIRDLDHFRKFNPLTLIEANWDRLALHGSGPRGFMQDLDAPRRWQNLYDQPIVQTGGPIVNDFARTWPPDWEQSSRIGTAAQPLPTPTAPVTDTVQPSSPTPPLPAGVRQLTRDNCCTSFYWSQDSTEIRFVDQPDETEPLGVWGIDINWELAQLTPRLVTEKLGFYSRSRDLVAYPDRRQGLAVIERLSDGALWTIDAQESSVSFTPDEQQILWTVYDSDVPWRARVGQLWLANIDGSNARQITTLRRGGPVTWLSDTELLIASRVPPTQDTLLSRLSIVDGQQTEIIQLPSTRGGAFSPDKQYLAYVIRFNENGDENGLWLVDLQATDPEPERLPFFGSYRWRNDQTLVYIPFEPEAETTTFFEYNIVTQKTRQLFPTGGQSLPLTITNNEWNISPDGSKISLLATRGTAIDGIWLIDLDR